jgi:aminopeptidase N
MRPLHIAAFVAILLLSCKSKEKTAGAPPSMPAPVTIDTAKIAAAEPEPKIYRESTTRTSDILHMKLEVNFDWANTRMNGRVTLKVRPYFYASDMLYLNARGMEIRSVEVFDVAKVTEQSVAGKKTKVEPTEVWHKLTNSSHKYENDSLKINLGKKFSADSYYYVVIDYLSKPNELKAVGGSAAILEDKGLYFVNPAGENQFKMPQIWTQGETQSNSVWFPTIDSPNERFTQELLINVEDKLLTLSNGSLVASTKQAGGTRTDHWKLDQPHAPYLTMMAIGEFKKVTDEPWKGKEISYYVERDYEPHAKAMFGDTREMIDFYSKRLGVDYPWPKYAQVVARDYVSGAMENTSATLHGDFMVYQTDREILDGKRGEAVIAHELFHQWFGDMVTAESWSNLPLNESFAVYGEYLWYEYKHGRAEADHHHRLGRQSYLNSKKEVDLIRFNYESREDMFDAFSYSKGGQVLHMLRKAVGDDAFFASLKNYLETNQFRPVEIHNLRLAFEETTGRDLNWFFNQWFLNKGRPRLKIVKTVVPGQVELAIEQQQDLKQYPLYRLPLEVDIYSAGKVERRHIEITEKKQSFKFRVEGTPELVNFDAERQLLSDLSYEKSREEFMAQYRLAPLMEDRLEALQALETKLDDEVIYKLFREAARKDAFHALRSFALFKIQKAPATKLADMKLLCMEAFAADSNNMNRQAALAALNSRFLNDADVIALNETALNDRSYAVASEALRSVAKRDPKLAVTRARSFENEPGKDIIFTVANIYSDHGGDGQIHFFHKSARFVTGFDMIGFVHHYIKTAKRCTSSTNAITAAMDLESISKGTNRYVKYSVAKGLKDLAAHWENRQATLRASTESAHQQGKATPEMETELKVSGDTKDILNEMYNRVK